MTIYRHKTRDLFPLSTFDIYTYTIVIKVEKNNERSEYIFSD